MTNFFVVINVGRKIIQKIKFLTSPYWYLIFDKMRMNLTIFIQKKQDSYSSSKADDGTDRSQSWPTIDWNFSLFCFSSKIDIFFSLRQYIYILNKNRNRNRNETNFPRKIKSPRFMFQFFYCINLFMYISLVYL